MKIRILSILLVISLMFGMLPISYFAANALERGASFAAQPAGVTGLSNQRTAAQTLLETMSLRDKITQMLMVDFRKWGNSASSATDFTVMNDQVQGIVADYRFGAVICFANNIKETEQSYRLMQAFQAAATKDGGIPLMISVDQEGGSVYRLGSGTALPGNMALGATYCSNGAEYAYDSGLIIGSELSALGINTALAPVVDVNSNPNNPVIGLRSYSDDATMVGQLAAANIEGMAEYNVIGCAKHFPGHGDTAVDSHYGLPMVDKSLAQLKNVELKPYELAIDRGIEMIMTAHILYPQLEKDKIVSAKTGKSESLPATMSDDILTGLLKNEMGFEGIVITDAMNMAGITESWTPVQASIIAINAGVDMLCMPCRLYCRNDLADLDAIIDAISKAVQNGEIPMSRINDAVSRILRVKENRGILDYDAADYSLQKANAAVGSDKNRDMEREMAAAAVTVIKNQNNVLPLELTQSSKVLMAVPYNNERAQMILGWNRAKQAGLIPEGAEVRYVRFSSDSTVTSLKKDLDWADTYIVNSEVSSASRMLYRHWLSNVPNEICNYGAANNKTVIISSVDKPYDVQMYPNADAIVAAYGCKGSTVDPTEALIGGATGSENAYGPNIIAAVEVILGTYGAQGKLPLDIPVFDPDTKSYTGKVLYHRGYGLTYDARKPIGDIAVSCIGGIDYCVSGQTVTVNHGLACKVGYHSEGTYIAIAPMSDTAGTYSFTAPDTAEEVLLVVKGDVTGDGSINMGDIAKIYSHIRNTAILNDAAAIFSADVTGDGGINMGDTAKIYSHIRKKGSLSW